jgi:peptide chain release factor 2
MLEAVVVNMDELLAGLSDAADLLEMAVEEGDADTVDAVAADLDDFEKRVAELEFRRMFSGELDANNAFLDIQAGSGGTEA